MIALMLNCAQVPSIRAWRPWTRILKSPENIELGKTLKIEVEGETDPLLGNENLLANDIKDNLVYLLERRGYKIQNKDYDYTVLLNYSSKSITKTNITSYMNSQNYSGIYSSFKSGYFNSNNYGVNIAKAVSSLVSLTSFTTNTTVSSEAIYNHTISIEILDHLNNSLWKSDSYWSSENPNILSNMTTPIQILLSDLPSDSSIIYSVPKVKENSILNFFELHSWNDWFACPALPYKIKFVERYSEEITGTGFRKTIKYGDKKAIDRKFKLKKIVPENVFDPHASAAYFDLIQTAEYALPEGDDDWYYPLRKDLWKKVCLGHKYYIGSEKDPKNIMIKLKGTKDCYQIEKCWIATDEEFEIFQQNLTLWQETLANYYDIYEN